MHKSTSTCMPSPVLVIYLDEKLHYRNAHSVDLLRPSHEYYHVEYSSLCINYLFVEWMDTFKVPVWPPSFECPTRIGR